MKIRPSHLVNAAVLGFASVISAASTIDDNKKDPAPPQEKVQLTPHDIPELLEKKLAIPEKLFDELLSKSDMGTQSLFGSLPRDIKIKIAKRAFNEQVKAIKTNSPDLEKKEQQVTNLFWHSIDNNDDLKLLLSESKSELQELIESYINAIADKENKRQATPKDSAAWNAWALDIRILNPYLTAAPPGLFKETWYPKIETIIERANKEFADVGRNSPQIYIHNVLSALVALEHKQDSGIKEPKIFQKLISAVEKNPKAYFPLNQDMLYNCITKEATINNNSTLIGPRESLIRPYENLVKKIIDDLPVKLKTPEDHELHNCIIQAAIRSATNTFSRPQLIIYFLDKRLSQISKANLEDIPEALTQFQEQMAASRFNGNKLIDAGKKYLLSIINTGFKGLLDEDSKNNDAGLRTILAAQGFYKNYIIPLTINESFNKLTNIALDRFKTKELKDGVAIKTYLDFILHIKQEVPDKETEILTTLVTGLNNQAQFTQRAKEKALNLPELLKLSNRDLELLRGASQLTDHLTHNPQHLKYIESLFKTLSQSTIKNAFRADILQEGAELMAKVSNLPADTNDEDKENKRFYKEAVLPYINSLLESSKNLSQPEKKDFHKQVCRNLSYFFNTSEEITDHRNLFILDDIIQSLSKNCFNPKDENKLDQFIHSSEGIALIGSPDTRWITSQAPHMMAKIVYIQRDYLNNAIKECGTLLDSPKIPDQVKTLKILSSYKDFIKRMKLNMDSAIVKHACTKDEKDTVETFLKSHLDTVNGMFIDKFGKVKVVTEKLKNFDHEIHKDVFIASTKTIEDFFSDHPPLLTADLTKQFLGIIDERLKVESDPHTRGMLYRTMAKFNPDKTLVLEQFKRAIVTEASPVTAKYIGEELGEMFFSELPEIKALRESFSTGNHFFHDGYKIPPELESLSSGLKKYGAQVKSASQEKMQVENNQSASNFILMLVNASQSREGKKELLLKASPPELRAKFESIKEDDVPDPQIIKAMETIISNSNCMLSGFVKNTSFDELIKQSLPPNRNLQVVDPQSTLKNALGEVHATIINILEFNLRWYSGPQNAPYISAGLIDIYEDNKKVDALAEKLFKGIEGRPSVYERHQGGLFSRYIWKYIEKCQTNKHNTKEDLEAIQTDCNILLKKLDKIDATKKPDLRKKMWKDLELEISELDSKLYSDMVRTPLINFRTRFLKEFIDLAPSRQRKEYLNIALNQFGLAEHFSEQELDKILKILN